MRIARLVPLGAGDRALPVGIGLDEARIDSEASAADQVSRDARFNDALENTAEEIALPETLIAGA